MASAISVSQGFHSFLTKTHSTIHAKMQLPSKTKTHFSAYMLWIFVICIRGDFPWTNTRLKISGVASQFATQISRIAIQSPHLICNLLHKITSKLIRNVKNCNTKLVFSIVLCEKFRKSLHLEKQLFWSLKYCSRSSVPSCPLREPFMDESQELWLSHPSLPNTQIKEPDTVSWWAFIPFPLPCLDLEDQTQYPGPHGSFAPPIQMAVSNSQENENPLYVAPLAKRVYQNSRTCHPLMWISWRVSFVKGS
jgi:hypothetical protein